ncbi:Membrane-associating domain family protein [Candida albicans]|uniref:Membrane-associating domain family protein n=1 Tax=Candida albicans TaxID=5476 RepID=A0A8H6C3P5_CANAX|nr:Membrane-associating domain family protein [Candida albicans]
MLAIGDVILRAFNFVFLVIALGLTGSLAATTITQHNPQINFAVFAAAFGLLTSSFYGVFAYFVAAFAWPVIFCSNQDYLDDNNIAQGSSGRCRKAQASTAFLYFSTFIFIASAIFSAISLSKGGLFGHSSRPAPRTGVPTMSQV